MYRRRVKRYLIKRVVRRKAEAIIQAAVARELSHVYLTLVPYLRSLKKSDTDTLEKGIGDWWNSFWGNVKDEFNTVFTALGKAVGIIADAENQFYQDNGKPAVPYNPQDILDHYSTGSRITSIADDTRQWTEEVINSWYFNPPLTTDDLIDQLTPIYGEHRAQLIAINETTLLNSAIADYMMRYNGLGRWKWDTMKDERVCPLCWDLEGQIFTLNDPMPPDASHIGCRCDAEPLFDVEGG